jgi:hypothetical protein
MGTRKIEMLKSVTSCIFATFWIGRLENIRIKLKDDGKSFVWKYFGYATDQSGRRIHEDQVFCSKCVEEKDQLKGYKITVSTYSLSTHLRDCHGILYKPSMIRSF